MGYYKRLMIEAMQPKEEPPMEVLGWVPVAARLPDDGVWVLWFNKSWNCQLVVAKRDGESLDWGGDLCHALSGFTHWMPLPETPD